MQKVSMCMTVYVPGWDLCNLDSSVDTKKLCPFCNSDRKGKYCALYMERLDKDRDNVQKTSRCKKATAYRAGETEHAPVDDGPKVEPKKLMQLAIDEYNKQVNNLVNQGYPIAIAQKVAREYVLGK